jgi:hypothetical protein
MTKDGDVNVVLGKAVGVLRQVRAFRASPQPAPLRCPVTSSRLSPQTRRLPEQVPGHYATDLNGSSGGLLASPAIIVRIDVPAPALMTTYRGVCYQLGSGSRGGCPCKISTNALRNRYFEIRFCNEPQKQTFRTAVKNVVIRSPRQRDKAAPARLPIGFATVADHNQLLVAIRRRVEKPRAEAGRANMGGLALPNLSDINRRAALTRCVAIESGNNPAWPANALE